MNRFTNASKTQKITIITLSVLIIAVVVYGAVAFTTRSWPFASIQGTTDAPQATKNPVIVMEKPTVDTTKNILHANAQVATKQQGTCKLTLSSKDHVYTLTNSTEGIEGKSGCLDWNIGTDSIPAGTYELEVRFIGKTQTASTKQTVNLP